MYFRLKLTTKVTLELIFRESSQCHPYSFVPNSEARFFFEHVYIYIILPMYQELYLDNQDRIELNLPVLQAVAGG